MYLIRELMYCKPGKVRPMVEKFTAMSKLSEKLGMPKMRVMTDFAGEHYWTVVAEMEVPDLQSFERMMSNPQAWPCGFWSRTKVRGIVMFPSVSFLIDQSPSTMASVVGGSGRLAPAFSRSLPETQPHTAW